MSEPSGPNGDARPEDAGTGPLVPIPPPPPLSPSTGHRDDAAASGSAGDTDRWHRLHPLSPIVRTGRAAYGLLIIILASLASRPSQGNHFYPDLILLGVVVTASIVSWVVTRWRIEGGDLRIETGLLRRSSKRFPLVQIQAVRMIEPVLWRPFGWCRLQVSVAGRHRSEGESEADRRQLRAVVPVGARDQAVALLERLLPDRPRDRLPPPGRARWKSPLRYHYLGWARTQTCVMTSSGRVTRVTDWVPLAKVQSLRSVQGPVQRRLRLVTIHVDAAGRNVHAAIRDRDSAEAAQILTALVELCRVARRGSERRRPA